MEQLHGKVIFTALDICDGYNNIQIHKEDSLKLAFKEPYEVYKPEVMLFGMTNAPVTFQQAMNYIFAQIKNRYPGCIFVYMDDILITTEDNKELHQQT